MFLTESIRKGHYGVKYRLHFLRNGHTCWFRHLTLLLRPSRPIFESPATSSTLYVREHPFIHSPNSLMARPSPDLRPLPRQSIMGGNSAPTTARDRPNAALASSL